MWLSLSTSGLNNSGSETLRKAAKRSDLVIVGRWVGLERDKGYGAPGKDIGWYAIARFKVDQVLRSNGLVEVGDVVLVPHMIGFGRATSAYPEAEFADREHAIPDEPAVLFLISWSSYFDRIGSELPDWVDELDRPDRYRTIGAFDGVLPLEDGRVVDHVNHADMPQWRIDAAGRRLDWVVAELDAR